MAVAGVVLAAGASRRMGRDKALLDIEGRPFLEAMTSALKCGGCDPVMAVISRPAETYRARCSLAGIDLVTNPQPAGGQISSLLCALDAAGAADGLLVTLVDQGWIDPGSVVAVRLALTRSPLVVARYGDREGHPTGFSAALFPALRSPEVERDGARVLVEQHRSAGDLAWVDLDDPGVVRNLNTPETYALAVAQSRTCP